MPNIFRGGERARVLFNSTQEVLILITGVHLVVNSN